MNEKTMPTNTGREAYAQEKWKKSYRPGSRFCEAFCKLVFDRTPANMDIKKNYSRRPSV